MEDRRTNNEPAQDFQQFYAEIRKYVRLQSEYVKVEIVEKMTILLSVLLIVGLVIVLSVAALFYLCFSLAYALQPVMGLSWAYVLVSGLYLFLIVVLLLFRKKLVFNPLVRFLYSLFIKNDDEV